MAYSKLFSSIVHSSLWTEEDHVRLLFVTLLAIADREGYIYGSRMGLERLANIGNHDRDPWQVLMEPDGDSSDLMRNPENEGRRIEQVPGGFRILNFLYYRGLRNEDDRRKTNREAKQRERARIKLAQQSASVNQGQPASAKVSQSLPISDADTDTDTDNVSTNVDTCPSAQEIYQAYPRHEARPDALKAIRKAIAKGFGAAFLLERTIAYNKTQPQRSRFTPLPATWFNAERFNDDPAEWQRQDEPKRKSNRPPQPWEVAKPKAKFNDLYS
jgi:hypothetical protein